MKKTFALSLVFSFVITFGYSQKIEESVLEDLRQAIEKEAVLLQKKFKVAGFSWGIVGKDGLILGEGKGVMNASAKKSDAYTVYRLGSISKTFVAVAILQMVEEGLFQLDDPVKKYLADFNPKSRLSNSKEITIRHLLTHQSGLPSDIYKDFFSKKDPVFQDIIPLLNKEFLISAPEKIHAYCNAGYSVLGVLIEEVSGDKFEDYLSKNIFDPLGMKYSHFFLKEETTDLYSSAFTKKSRPLEESHIRDVPAGMLHSSIVEMAPYMQAILNHGNYNGFQLLDSISVALMFTQQNKEQALDLDLEMGLGWFLRSEWSASFPAAGRMVGHGGDTEYYHADMKLLQEKGLGVIVLTNSPGGASLSRRLTQKLLENVCIHLLEMPKQVKDKDKEKPGFVLMETKDLAQYEGFYTAGMGALQVKAKKGNLVSKVDGIKIKLKPLGEGDFMPVLVFAGFLPFKMKGQTFWFGDIEDESVIVAKNGKRKSLLAVRRPFPEIPDSWNGFIGKYENEDGDAEVLKTAEMKVKKGELVLAITFLGNSKGELHLEPLSDKEAVVSGIGRGTGATLSISEKDGHKYIYWSGVTFKLKK